MGIALICGGGDNLSADPKWYNKLMCKLTLHRIVYSRALMMDSWPRCLYCDECVDEFIVQWWHPSWKFAKEVE